MSASPSAWTVRCARCGSTLPLRQLAPQVQCTHCGALQPVDPRLLAQLQGYQQRMQGGLAQILHESHVASQDLVKQLRRRPLEAATLGTVVLALARLARSLGAEPIGAIA